MIRIHITGLLADTRSLLYSFVVTVLGIHNATNLIKNLHCLLKLAICLIVYLSDLPSSLLPNESVCSSLALSDRD